MASQLPVYNLTQHAITIGERTYPAAAEDNPARLYTHKEPRELPDHTSTLGVRVIERYEYENLIGLPREEVSAASPCAVIVSQMVAEWLVKADVVSKSYYLGQHTSVYTPDTDKGAIREHGVIKGSKQLIFWLST